MSEPMTPTDRRAYILAATCEGCHEGVPAKKVEGHAKLMHIDLMATAAYGTMSPCTANHALADEVEKWIKQERLAEFELIVNERPADPVYWDMHHRKDLEHTQ